jgi:hypothetical protein
MSRVTRRSEIDRRRARRNKIRKLRARMARAKNSSEVQTLLARLKKAAPAYPHQQLNDKGQPTKMQQPAKAHSPSKDAA